MAYLEPCVTLAYSEPCHIALCCARTLRPLPYLGICHIQNLAYFGPELDLVLCQMSKMEGLTKLVQRYNHSSTMVHLNCLTRF